MKVLIINLYGPSKVRPGALHVRALGRELAQRGHDVCFLTSTVDEISKWENIGTSLRIPVPYTRLIESAYEKIKNTKNVSRPYKTFVKRILRRFMQSASNFLFAPDYRILWCRRAVKAAMSSFKTSSPDAIVSIGHAAAHMVANELWEAHFSKSAAWIADFEDPWPNSGSNPITRVLNLKRRNRTLASADKIVVVTPGISEEMSLEDAVVVPFGSNFNNEGNIDYDYEVGSIAYYGNLYRERGTETFLQGFWIAIKKLESLHNSFPIHIKFFSNSAATECGQLVKKLNLERYVTFKKPVPYKDVFQSMNKQHILVTIQGNIHKYAISSKIYDYVMTDRPILGVVPPDSQEAVFLKQFPGSYIANFPDNVAKDLISIIYDENIRYSRPEALRYTKNRIGKELAEIVEDTIKKINLHKEMIL